jgi:hypothetical protein
MTSKELQNVFVTAVVASVATTLTGLLVMYAIEKGKEAQKKPLTPEEAQQAEQEALQREAQQWLLAGMGCYCRR